MLSTYWWINSTDKWLHLLINYKKFLKEGNECFMILLYGTGRGTEPKPNLNW